MHLCTMLVLLLSEITTSIMRTLYNQLKYMNKSWWHGLCFIESVKITEIVFNGEKLNEQKVY